MFIDCNVFEITDDLYYPAIPWKRQEMMAKLAPACRVHDADRRKVWETCLRRGFGRQVPERNEEAAQ